MAQTVKNMLAGVNGASSSQARNLEDEEEDEGVSDISESKEQRDAALRQLCGEEAEPKSIDQVFTQLREVNTSPSQSRRETGVDVDVQGTPSVEEHHAEALETLYGGGDDREGSGDAVDFMIDFPASSEVSPTRGSRRHGVSFL